MLTYDIVSEELDGASTNMVIERIEQIIDGSGLKIHRKMTLASYKGSIHYHLTKAGEKGVLEVTYWPNQSRLWLDIADNRRALWNLSMVEEIGTKFANIFGGRVVPR